MWSPRNASQPLPNLPPGSQRKRDSKVEIIRGIGPAGPLTFYVRSNGALYKGTIMTKEQLEQHKAAQLEIDMKRMADEDYGLVPRMDAAVPGGTLPAASLNGPVSSSNVPSMSSGPSRLITPDSAKGSPSTSLSTGSWIRSKPISLLPPLDLPGPSLQ